MNAYVALLRAVNVGGKTKLPMADLHRLCERAGFENVKTYIQSGNVVFTSELPAKQVKQRLAQALERKMRKPVDVFVRTPTELEVILRRNPFKTAPPNRVLISFLDQKPPKNAFANLSIPGREQVKPSGREVFVHYPDGQGRSKLKVPLADKATARNLNTVQKLLELGRAAAVD